MTKTEARQALFDASAAIQAAVNILHPHAEFFRQYARERGLMESVGPVLNPTLFLSSERKAVDALLAPMFADALTFVTKQNAHIEKAKSALEKVSS